MGSKRLTYEVALPNRQQRFRELLIYIAQESQDDEAFGATKLNKLLWRADFLAFFRHGVPLTGTKYMRLKRGPAPKCLLPVCGELIAEGAIKVDERVYLGKPQKRVVPWRAPDLSLFTQAEIALVNEVIRDNWGKSATQVSNESHGLAWKTREDRELIPYEAEYISDDSVSVEDQLRTSQLVSELGYPRYA